jgi:phenylalanyl-tRNA synthetase beta chain
MIISENWLREWIALDFDTTELIRVLNMGGLEVESVHRAGPALDQVVVGRIVSVEAHPNADKLRICQVDAGATRPVDVVCGAPNAREGLLAPMALVGATLPGGNSVERAQIRGTDSEGMLCSARELDLGDQADGLMELDENGQPGQQLQDYLDLDDTIIEIELTANRGDCLSILGMARELSVLTGASLTHPTLPVVLPESESRIDISLESPERCPRYVGRVIEDINVAVATPLWMSERLRRCGVRPVSPVVDVTNYVMLETGQPMHAFDKARLDQRIIVRQAHQGEPIELLDGSSQELDADTLVIADAASAVAIAGVMGGEHSAISDDTVSIVLEAAFFTPEGLSGHARRYGLNTDASHRFERGVDPELPRIATNYATALLRQITGGIPGPVLEAVKEEFLPVRSAVLARQERINKLIGIDIPEQDVDRILRRVGSTVDSTDAGWLVEPPSHRFDISIECDLIEEIARVRGYDQLPASIPVMALDHVEADEQIIGTGRVKSALVDRGYREVITYSFVDPVLQHRFSAERQEIELKNPLASNLSVMRTSLWPGLMQVLIDNVNRQHRRVRIFEIGKTFHLCDGKTVEIERISGVITGSAYPEQWGQPEREADFFDLKSDIEALFALTRAGEDFIFEKSEQHPALHPGQAARILKDSVVAGFAGRLHPKHQRALDLSQTVYLFEIELPSVNRKRMPEYAGISRFPAIRRDLAVWVKESVSARELLDLVDKTAGEYLVNLELFDVYRREDVDSKRKSMAFSLTLQASSRTLTDRDVDSIVDQTLRGLHEQFGAELRT